MPFGVKNASVTFQRVINNFRSSLKDIFILSYLEDIIVLLETFEENLEDLKEVFHRHSLFKQTANREKCNFACSKI